MLLRKSFVPFPELIGGAGWPEVLMATPNAIGGGRSWEAAKQQAKTVKNW